MTRLLWLHTLGCDSHFLFSTTRHAEIPWAKQTFNIKKKEKWKAYFSFRNNYRRKIVQCYFSIMSHCRNENIGQFDWILTVLFIANYKCRLARSYLCQSCFLSLIIPIISCFIKAVKNEILSFIPSKSGRRQMEYFIHAYFL